ncbi:contactin-5 isoform X2 [Protopterus annectens]|uniref:contactin-5 isoform X2 n=1 Tax=Protopterus annectens TaxID=7888 RepID=UPI001CFA89F8|nr:contactin-5 isoform X2 [Protopterus annectens]
MMLLWKPILILTTFGCLSDFSEAVVGQTTSYAAILRIKPGGSTSSLFSSRFRPQYSSSRQNSNRWQDVGNPFHSSTDLFYFRDSMQHDESLEYGPIFTQEPTNIVFPIDSEGEKVVLNCEARGNPTPIYRWLRNGTILDMENDYRYSLVQGSLIISNPTDIKDTGRYQCLTSNAFGSIISHESTIQFAYLGNFSGRTRSAVSVREGQGVVLICSPPAHSPEITYSWVFNQFPSFVAEDSRRFISQETGNLYIAKVQTSDVGSYICLVKNMVTNTRVLSPPTPLTLRTDGVMGEYEPKIEVHFPFTVTAPKATTVRLECFALGNPVPIISWRKVNGNIPNRARLRKSQAVLEITNLQLDDAGTYECKAENLRGRNVFRGQLQVYSHPHWLERINDTQLDSGEDLHWECKASGKPKPTYRWLKNGIPLSSQSKIEMFNGALSIRRVNQSDAGMYQCVAESKYGVIYASAELKILASAPAFEQNPMKKTIVVTVGKEAIIECKPQASPRPLKSWKRGGKALKVNKRITVLQDGSLRIMNASKSDEGIYICKVENVFGSAEMVVSLFVKEPTKMELTPDRAEITVGESIVLNCRAFHDPTLEVTFHWSLNNQPIDFHEEGGYFENIRTASSADLMIRNILSKHAGKYGCKVQTSVDSISDESEIIVKGPPGAPGVVIVEEISDTTATLSWSPAADNHSPVTSYNLQARSAFSLGWQTVKTVPDPVTGEMESAMAIEMNPWVEYEFRVVATNSIGTGDPSLPSRVVRTKEAVPTVAPSNVSGGSGRRHELVITWEPTSEEFQNGEGFGYIVAFRVNGTRGWKEKMVTSADASKFIYKDETIPPLTAFEVKVGTYNNKGDGPFSPTVIIFSSEGEPRTAPADVTIASVSASEIFVTWKALTGSPGKPKGYEVNYWKDDEQEDDAESVKTVENNVILSGLEGDTVYHISVRGYNQAGYGPASNTKQIVTKKSPPSQAPDNLMWMQDGLHVSLGWEPVRPLANESEVLGYKVFFRQEGHSTGQIVETNKPSAVVSLPESGVYIIEVRALSEGGDGAASSQIRVEAYSGAKITNSQASTSSITTSPSSVTLLLVLVVPSASW